MDVQLLIGLSGMLCILIAFIGDETGKLLPKDLSYQILNLVGSVLLAWYAVLLASIPFLILNAVWGMVAVWRIAKRF
jgi:hypothetical protein